MQTISRRSLLASMLASERRPNILLMLADDLGYGDLGCFGGRDIRTPHLDRLASEGLKLTHHYVCSPVCSASRAGLLTGRYPQRTGITGVLRDQHDSTGMSVAEETVADSLSTSGYETALIGKWHLGMSRNYWPRRRGFQHFYGFLSGTIDYDTHVSRGGGGRGERSTYRNESPVHEKGYYPDLLTEEAVRFLRKPRQNPFFLFFSNPLPHLPLQAPQRWSAPYRELGEEKAVYAGMVACLDDSVGQLMAALRASGQDSNTLVVFLSDHGWVKLQRDASRDAGSNGPLRGGKYELSEGGIRTPCIVRWPGAARAGSVSDAPTISLDWLPTLREVAGASRPPKNPVDGISLSRLLLAGHAPPERTLHWTFEDRLVGTPRSYAARRGRWKMLRVADEAALYDLQRDPGEQRDIAARQPDIMKRLRQQSAEWAASLPDVAALEAARGTRRSGAVRCC